MFTQITVRGEDARNFLQGQLTQDIAAVSDTCSPLAAWCTPKGRVVALLRLINLSTGVGMVLPTDLADKVATDLQRYRLRARAEFSIVGSGWHGLAIDNDADLAILRKAGLLPDWQSASSRRVTEITAVCLDPAKRVIELYGDTESLGLQTPLGETDWREARIRAGIADISAVNSEQFTPHMLNLDRLGAVSFDKGCYAGQEIVARTQHLGNAKRRVAPFQASTAVPVGSAVELDGKTLGVVVAAAGSRLLALLPLDAHDRTLAVEGARLLPAGDH